MEAGGNTGNSQGKSKTQVLELSKAMEETIKRIQVFYVTSASASGWLPKYL